MILRPATTEDSAFLFRLRNDPATRRASLHDAELSWPDHVAWLARALRDPARCLFVAEEQGMGIGSGRLDLCRGVAELSLIVAPASRGRGYARQIITALLAQAQALGARECAAVVRPSNARSLAAFTAEGFDGEPVRLALTRPAWARRLCEHCAAGAPHHTNAIDSIGGENGRHPIWELHVSTGGGLAECLAADLWE